MRRFGPAAPGELWFSRWKALAAAQREQWSGKEDRAGERAGGRRVPTAGLNPPRTSSPRTVHWLGLLRSAQTLRPCALPLLTLPLLPVERFIRNNSSTSFFPRVEVLQEGKKLPETKGRRAQPSSPFLPGILSASASVSVVFGLWWCTVKAAAAICSVMKQGAAMAPKGLVYSTNLPSTHFLLRILTPNLIVKSRIDWKMQMAI